MPVIIFIFAFISLYPLTEMFFIRDDFAIVYKLQQNLPISAPYGHLLTFFKPIYPLFKLNPYPYYLSGIILFSISAVIVFQFLKKISNTKIALFATLLYATGLISLENLIMMELISPIPVLTIVTISFIMLFLKFTETGKKKYYLISLLLYIFSLVFFSYRAHLLYSYVFLVDFFFIFSKISIKDLKKEVTQFIVRQLPYAIVFFFWLNNASKTSGLVTTSYYLGLFDTPLRDNIIINFTNLFLQPAQIVIPGLDISVSKKISIGIGTLFISVILGIYALVKKQRQNAILLFFSLSAIFANLIAYFLFNPDFQIQGISRYNFLNAINFNIYIAATLFLTHKLINNRLAKYVILGVSVGIFLSFFFASFLYIKDFNKTRSIPAKTFWSQLKQFMPAIPKGALIYVDRKEILPFDPSEFVRVGMLTTEASFASMYNVPIEYLTYTKSFDDVEKKFIDDKSSISNIFAFYLNENKLINITQEVRKGLATPEEITLSKKHFKYNSVEHIVIDCENYSVGLPPVLEIDNFSVPSFTPVTVTIPIQIQLLDLASIKYPYYQIKGMLLDNDELKNTPKTDVCNTINELTFKNNTPPDVIQYIKYIKRQEELLQTVEVTGSKTLPEDPVRHIIDDDPRTVWTSDVTDWEKNKKANIIVTFASNVAIKKLFLVPANYQRLPKNLTVSSLSDDKTWKAIQTIDNAVMEENVWYEINLPTTNTKSLQITITDTNTGKYPQIADLYFVEGQWGNINTDFLRAFKENPFLFVPDLKTAYELQSYLINNQKESIFWKRDKDSDFSENNYKKFSIFQDGILHTYPITIPAGGTILENLRLEGFNLPSTVSIIDIQ